MPPSGSSKSMRASSVAPSRPTTARSTRAWRCSIRSNVYFHRIVVEDDGFDQLAVGSEVMYSLAEAEGPMGPQASRVRLLRGHHSVR
jgi:cold shock CspA family protein